MENKIIFLLISILILYLLLTNKGKDLINGLITSTPSSGAKVDERYGTVEKDGSVSGNIAGDKQTPYDGNNSSIGDIFSGGGLNA